MKIARTIASIVFIIGTIAIIVYDARTENKKQTPQVVKSDSSKVDTTTHVSIRK
jgi:hypothetical protein